MIAKRLQRLEDVQYAQYTGDLGKRPYSIILWHAWETRGSIW